MLRRSVILIFGLLVGARVLAAPNYEATRSLAGTLHLWGPPSMAPLARQWAEGFRRLQPGIQIEINFLGSDTAIPGLYAGRADIAFLGRENNLTDDNGFSRPMGYPPQRFEVTSGSLNVPGKTPALVVLVHKDNPLPRITLAQLDAIFGLERRRGAPAVIRKWGQLGLGGKWTEQSIRLYGHDATTGTGQFFTKAVLGGSHKMNWDTLAEFADRRNLDGTHLDAAEQIVAALRDDPWGLAVSSLRWADETVRIVPLAATDDGAAVIPTRATVVSREYPLARVTYASINRPPGQPIEPKVREFLRYLFSREGQGDIVSEGDYLPLSDAVLAAQLRRLE